MHGLHLGQQVAELPVVHLHAVIKVQRDPPVRVVTQRLVERQQLHLLLLQRRPLLVEALSRGRRGRGLNVALELLEARSQSQKSSLCL